MLDKETGGQRDTPCWVNPLILQASEQSTTNDRKSDLYVGFNGLQMNSRATLNPKIGEAKRALRWDLVGLGLASAVAVALIFLLDTSPLAEWVAKHRESKIDEV